MKLAALLFSFLFAHAALAELPAQMNRVFSYRCEATFLEGEGVTPTTLSCAPFQQLGLLKASYTHYVTDLARQSSDEFYPETVCNLQVLRSRCVDNMPELRFGLAASASESFPVPVQLSPGFGQAPELVGYAADAVKGKCAEGLELRQAYRAVPRTIRSPLPTSFVNANGSLDDVILIPPTKKLPRFEVQRERNNISCDDVGDCRAAQFDTAVGIQRVDYKAGVKPVCVVPKSSL